jgi:hypothetical protein
MNRWTVETYRWSKTPRTAAAPNPPPHAHHQSASRASASIEVLHHSLNANRLEDPTVYTDKYYRIWTGPFPFNGESGKQNAPATSGVYQILYLREVVCIGISVSSIRDRLVKHVTGLGNWAAAYRASALGYAFVYFLCDAMSARQIESHVVTNEKPPFNVKPEYKHYIDNITVH